MSVTIFNLPGKAWKSLYDVTRRQVGTQMHVYRYTTTHYTYYIIMLLMSDWNHSYIPR